MTGIVVLDIVIGLVFIYALYSLLITTIVEFVALAFQLRAKNLKRALRRMLDDGSIKVFYDDFVKIPLIKNLSSNRFSWFFNINTFPSYISPKTFSKALVYLLSKIKSDSEPNTESKTLPEKISMRLGSEELKDMETVEYISFLLFEADGNIEKFIKSLEEWFDSTMERCVGWYKKNVTFLTLGVAFILSMLFNIDTLQFIDQLSKDDKAREQYVELAGQLLSNEELTNPAPVFDSTLEKRLLNDTALFKRLGSDSVTFVNAITDSVNQQFAYIQKVLFSRMDTLYATSQKVQEVLSFKREKQPHWFFDSWLNLLGCLITALALSLGAPFWFDLLNKFMKLRSSLAMDVKKNEGLGKDPAAN
jgi:hypothetical protein